PELLRKPGKLTPAEFEVVKQHPALGAKLLRTIPQVDDLTVLVAYEHHMRYDGGGYPERAHPRTPNLASRLCTIADYYDALRTIRSYKKEITPDEALKIMSQGAGTVLDPVLFKHFVELVGLYPRGCVVQLSDGSSAVVVATRPGFATRPTVRVVTDGHGTLLAEPQVVDLATTRGDGALKIERALDPEAVPFSPEAYV
ncbi:MAG: HD domain-containing protein, partial [Nitrospirae bacterium]